MGRGFSRRCRCRVHQLGDDVGVKHEHQRRTQSNVGGSRTRLYLLATQAVCPSKTRISGDSGGITREGWPLTMLGFSTAAWKLAPRDRFIGSTPLLSAPLSASTQLPC